MKKTILMLLVITLLFAVESVNAQEEINVTTPAPGGLSGCIPVWNSSFTINTTSIVNSNIFKSGNNIGIGTNNPLCRLQVGGSGNPRIGIGTLDDGSYMMGNYYLGFNLIRSGVDQWQFDGMWSKGGAVILSTLMGGFNFITVPNDFQQQNPYTDNEINDRIRMSIAPNGNVGIGTSTDAPQSKLHVNGAITVPYAFVLNRYESSFLENPSRPIMHNNWTEEFGDYLYIGSTGNTSNMYQSAMILTQGHGIKFGLGSDDANNVTTEWMRISTNGNVGIGKVNPEEKLDVNGKMVLGNASNPGLIKFRRPVDGLVAATIGFHPTNDNEFAINSWGGSSYIVFKTGDQQERMRIDYDGNVTIGDIKLYRDGKIWVKNEVQVNLTNPWGDFIFDEGYKPMPLMELEAYIKEYKHLPGLPSAKEVEKEGIKLGEMTNTLTQKVEELTLYIIEMNKSLIEANKKIEKLEKENIELKNN